MINCTFGSGGGYIKPRHSSQEGMYYDTSMDVEIYKTPLGLSRLKRGRSCAYQTTSGHEAKHVLSSHVSPEEGVTICLVRSGPTITSTLLAPRLGLRTRRLGLRS